MVNKIEDRILDNEKLERLLIETHNRKDDSKARFTLNEYFAISHTIGIIMGISNEESLNVVQDLKKPTTISEFIAIYFTKLHYFIHSNNIYLSRYGFFLRYRFDDEIQDNLDIIHDLLDNDKIVDLLPDLLHLCEPLIKFFTLMYYNYEILDREFYSRMSYYVSNFLNSEFNFFEHFSSDELLPQFIYLEKNEISNRLAKIQNFLNNTKIVKTRCILHKRMDNICDVIDKISFMNAPLTEFNKIRIDDIDYLKNNALWFSRNLKNKNEFFNTLFILDYEFCQNNNYDVYSKSLEELKNYFTGRGGTLNFQRHTGWRNDTEIYNHVMERIHLYIGCFGNDEFLHEFININWIRDYFLKYQNEYKRMFGSNGIEFCVLPNTYTKKFKRINKHY